MSDETGRNVEPQTSHATKRCLTSTPAGRYINGVFVVIFWLKSL